MLSASPIAAAVLDPAMTTDTGATDATSAAAMMVAETTETATEVMDVPQENSGPGDSDSDLLQQFGLAESADELQQNLQLIFIDEATENYQQLIEDLIAQGDEQHQIEIILLDSEQDGILQISEALEYYTDVDAVHIVSHGSDNAIKLGATWLSSNNLDQYSDELTAWGNSFTAETDLLFYGCNLAGSDSGQELLQDIQTLTGADIAASTNNTGAAALGGDWDLEFKSGNIETAVIFSTMLQENWLGLLATETMVDQFSSQSYGNNHGTQNWSGDWVEFDTSGGSQSASNGDVRIIGGDLRMVGESGAPHSVTREVDLSSAHDATLSFDAYSSGTEANDKFSVQISKNGGGSWTVLDELTDYTGSYSKDISSWMAADTQIRIEIDSGYDGGLLGLVFVEYLYIDDVQISYTVNNPPVITSDGGSATAAVNTPENTTVVTTVAATDANLDTLSYAITGGTDAAAFTIDSSTGVLAFSMTRDYESPVDSNTDNVYEVIVEVSDGFGGTDLQTISVTVTPVNETPTASGNTITTNEDSSYTFTAADFNFSDIDGDTLASVKITSLETVGALQLSGVDVTLNQVISKADLDAGNLTFTPVANANGSSYDSFAFVVSDGTLESSPASTLTVDVTAVNDAPTATNKTVTTNEDTPYTFTAADFNFSDIDGDSLASVKITSLETVGALQLSGVDVTLNQVISKADLDAGNLTFAPVANANGSSYDSFAFVVSDGTLESSPASTMTVDVTAVNDAPTASGNTVTTNEDTSYTFTAADFNFSDIDGDSLVSVKITSLETVGALQLSGVDVTLNQVISKADIDAGNLTFTPVANANGSSYDSFAFVVSDGTLESSPASTMTVDVTAVNDAPTAANKTVTTNEDTPYTFTAADFNFSDVDGDLLASVKITSLETVGALQLSGVDVTLNQVISKADIDAGNLTFTPVANANGSSYDSFAFVVSDGTLESSPASTMTVDVTAVNDAPTATNKTVTTNEDTPYTFTAADFNFSDVDGDLLASVKITSLETVGVLQLSGIDVTLNQVISKADLDAGNLTFTPVANANGSSYDSFAFVVSDGTLESTPANTMTVDITAVNDAPTATNKTVTTNEDTPYTFTAADFNFSDIDGDTLVSVKITSLETVGALQLSGVDVTLNQVISKAGLDAGNLRFTPVANANGSSYDSFAFVVSDGTLESTPTNTMTVDITAVNDAPTASGNTVTTNEDTSYTFAAADFNFSDIDGDSLASVKITSLETVGALQLSGVDVTLNQVISRADIDAGNLTFAPVANANGSSYDSFAFLVSDGTLESSPANTMTFDITAVNDAPTAANNTVATSENMPYVFIAADFNFSDIDGDTLTSVKITSLETVGTLQLSGVDVALNQVISRADIDAGNLTFTPVANENGVAYDSFEFVVHDGTVEPATAYTMSINVGPVNNLPTATDNTVVTSEDTPYTFTAADFNFSDIDGGTLSSVKITALETVGALQLSGVDVTLNQVISRADIDAGNLTFTPVANANGSSYDSFAFVVSDGVLESIPANTMTVDITAVNDAPAAADKTVTTNEDMPYTFTAADFNFSDIDGDSLTSVRITSLETVGALQLSGVDVTLIQVISRVDLDAGDLTWVPVADVNGLACDNFSYVVNDGTVESLVANTITIDVTPMNDAPIITSGGGGPNAIIHVSNQLSTVHTVEASDVEVEAALQVLSFSITGGFDSDKFLIDVETGELSLVLAPEYQILLDSNLDNNYEVVVQVSDGFGGIATQLIQVIVEQDNEIIPFQDPTDDPGQEEESDDSGDSDESDDSDGNSGNEDLPQISPSISELDLLSGAMFKQLDHGWYSEYSIAVNKEFSQFPHESIDLSFKTLFDDLEADHRHPGESEQFGTTSKRPADILDPVQDQQSPNYLEVVNASHLWTNFDGIQNQINFNSIQNQILISTAAVVVTSVSSGLLIWALQGGYLMASIASGLPAWRYMDPIAILANYDEHNNDEDGDTLQSIIEQSELKASGQNRVPGESEKR